MTAEVRELRPGIGRLADGATGEILPDARKAAPGSARVKLRLLARLDVEQAREFLTGLDGRIADANASQLAYLLGCIEGHAQSLLDIIDTITET
jgi:hypothetical protein